MEQLALTSRVPRSVTWPPARVSIPRIRTLSSRASSKIRAMSSFATASRLKVQARTRQEAEAAEAAEAAAISMSACPTPTARRAASKRDSTVIVCNISRRHGSTLSTAAGKLSTVSTKRATSAREVTRATTLKWRHSSTAKATSVFIRRSRQHTSRANIRAKRATGCATASPSDRRHRHLRRRHL